MFLRSARHMAILGISTSLVRSMPRVNTVKSADPEQQLQNFIGKFEPKRQAVIRAGRKALRKRFRSRPNSLTTATISLSSVSGRQSALRTASSLSQPPPMESDCALSAAPAFQIRQRCFSALANRRDFFVSLQQRFFSSPRFRPSSPLPRTRRRRFLVRC